MNSLPQHIGRFRIERILGQGGFGVVYLGHDEKLQRRVAIKIPKPQFVQRTEDKELYLKEARTVAGLEHPNIVSRSGGREHTVDQDERVYLVDFGLALANRTVIRVPRILQMT